MNAAAAPAPAWVRALGAVVRRLPRGRYRLVSSIRASPAPFVAALGDGEGGARFVCDLTDEIAREVCLTGCYEPPVTRILQRHLAPGRVMVDVGANWGYFSLLAAAAVGTSGRVLALEPDPRQFARLHANARLNGFTQMTAIAAAASASRGSAILSGYREDTGNRGVSRIAAPASGAGAAEADDAHGPRFDVECVTVDGTASGLARVDIVKIDVEGAELDVLRGMHAGLAQRTYRALLLEIHPELLRLRGQTGDACVRLLLDAGYRGWTIDQSPRTYVRAADARLDPDALLLPLAEWTRQPWPHLFWIAPGQESVA
jgi:FkbM family methyltransferase